MPPDKGAPTAALRAVRPALGSRGWGLARRKHHDHLAAFELRLLLDLGDRADIAFHAIEQLGAKLLMRHFPPAEAKGYFHLVAFLEEALHGTHLNLVVVIVDHRPELDLLDLDDFLLFAGFSRLLLRLVFVFAVIQDLADGGR